MGQLIHYHSDLPNLLVVLFYTSVVFSVIVVILLTTQNFKVLILNDFRSYVLNSVIK